LQPGINVLCFMPPLKGKDLRKEVMYKIHMDAI